MLFTTPAIVVGVQPVGIGTGHSDRARVAGAVAAAATAVVVIGRMKAGSVPGGAMPLTVGAVLMCRCILRRHRHGAEPTCRLLAETMPDILPPRMVDTSDKPDVSCFFSYMHSDNDQFDEVVTRLRDSLTALYEARTGKTLAIFLDRDSIGWGDDWRDEIQKHLRGAMVFIPFITMRYFKSTSCCEELLTFFENAEQLGVTDLILPIVLMGEGQITEDHAQQEVRLIARLQYRSFEEAWIAGPATAWRQGVLDLVSSLDRAMTSAEVRLTELEVDHDQDPSEDDGSGGSVRPSRTPGPSDGGGAELDLPSLLEKSETIASLIEEISDTLERFAETANDVVGETDLDKLTPGQLTFKLGALAERLKHPSLELEAKASLLQSAVGETDVALRYVMNTFASIDHSMARDQLGALKEGLKHMDQLSEPLSQTDELISFLKMLGLMKVSVRKSLQPAVRGLQNIKIAMSTVHSWRRLAH